MPFNKINKCRVKNTFLLFRRKNISPIQIIILTSKKNTIKNIFLTFTILSKVFICLTNYSVNKESIFPFPHFLMSQLQENYRNKRSEISPPIMSPATAII